VQLESFFEFSLLVEVKENWQGSDLLTIILSEFVTEVNMTWATAFASVV